MITLKSARASLVFACLALTMLAGLSCTAEVQEPMDPNPSDDIHTIHRVFDDLDADRASNATRFENIAKNKDPRKFIGEITEIKGSRLYFHVVFRDLGNSDYAICDFIDETPLTSDSINLGNIVKVMGYVQELPGPKVPLLQLEGRKLLMTKCSFL